MPAPWPPARGRFLILFAFVALAAAEVVLVLMMPGVNYAGADGKAAFNTVYPGWYAGRATHIHLEVFVNGVSVKTTQMAFPEDVTAAVYATGVYAARGQNPTHNSNDNVFSDGTTNELATLSGSPSAGYVAALQIGI